MRQRFFILLPALLALVLSIHWLGEAALYADDAPPRLRVLTYNIHHGEGTDGKFDLPRIAKVILDQKPDLVSLQEVDVKTKRSGGVDQAAELAKLTGMHVAFGKAIEYAGGQYGDAVLSRWKPAVVKAHPLPASKGHEDRVAVEVTVQLDGKLPPVTFIATHLDHMREPADRLAQAARLNELFAAESGPGRRLTILAGDLNAEPKDDEIKRLTALWQLAKAPNADAAPPTYPSDKPAIAIDHILLRPANRWRTLELKVIDEKAASDHRPLLAVVELIAPWPKRAATCVAAATTMAASLILTPWLPER